MKKIEFRLGKHVYQKYIQLSGIQIYFKDGIAIDEDEYETARALFGAHMTPTTLQTEQDLMWAICNHIKVASN